MPRYRLSIRIALIPLLALAVWAITPLGLRTSTPAAAKPGDFGPPSLYMLEQRYGRSLLPLGPADLTDYSGWAPIQIKGVSRAPMVSQPTIAISPNGQWIAVTTYACGGCTNIHLKYMNVRVVDAGTSIAVAKFHPDVATFPIAISNDGTRLFGWRSGDLGDGEWDMLDAHSGRVLATTHTPENHVGWQFDPATATLIQGSTDSAHHLVLTAYDGRTANILGHVTLDGVPAGPWTHLVNGQPMTDLWQPAMALTPDGKSVTVLDGQNDTLTVVDVPAMRVVSTHSLSRPEGLLHRIGRLLGIVPESALAKGPCCLGAYLTMQFSHDGKALYLAGSRTTRDTNGALTRQFLGIERIDVASGTIQAQTLKGRFIAWLGESADGKSLYSLAPSPQDDVSCPCTLNRHDASSLEVTAQRSFNVMPRLFVIGR